MNKDKLISHIAHLEQSHTELDQAISEGHTHFMSDKNLSKMKQQRLMLKREIIEAKTKLEGLV